MQTGRRIALLELAGDELGRYADLIPLDTAVPTCPDWDVRALLGHVGMVHRWAAEHVRGGTERYPDGTHPVPETAPQDGLAEWYRAGFAELLTALRSAPDDLAAYTFLADAGAPREFWVRRQLHETVVHGADLLAAGGQVPALDPELAVDGIGELLEGFLARPRGRLRADPPVTLRVAPTDAPVSWLVSIEPERRVISRDAGGPADCTLSGMAADLYLDLWNRWPAGAVTVEGDPGVVERWRQSAHVRWS